VPLEQPQRDSNGEVIPYDCDDIDGIDVVIRRISEEQMVPDGKGGRRVSSMAFKKSSGPNGGMSVDIEKLIVEADIRPKEYVTTPRWMGSVRFSAKTLRDEGFMIGWDPKDHNPYHGEVWGSFTPSKVKRLQQLAAWYVPIEGVHLNQAA
jgi:hypothetical protein